MWESANTILYYNFAKKELIYTGTYINFFVSDSTKYGHAFICKLDSFGQNTIKSTFASPPHNVIGYYPVYTGSSIILKYEEQKQNAFDNKLFYMSTDGDTIASYQVEYPPKFNSLTYTLHPSNKFIYSMGKDITNSASTTAPFAILCIDTTGKQLWYKTYPGKRRYTNSVVVDDDGNFVIAGSSYKGDGGAFDTTSGWYAKLDTAGNFIWEIELNRKSTYFTDVLSVFKAESAFFLSSNNDASYFDAHVKDTSFVSLFKINEDGDIEWFRRYLENPYKKNIWAGRFIESNNFAYGIGGYITDEGWQNYTQYSMLVKVDLSGNLIWKRLFKQWHRDNRFFSLTAVPDGFIICADGKDTTHTTGITDAWIIKTDTNGCIIPGCHLTDGLVQLTSPDAFVLVYPNPATDKITVQITDNRAKLKSYSLYDAKGNFIKQQALINHPQTVEIVTNNLSAGNYYLVLELQDGERAVKIIIIQR